MSCFALVRSGMKAGIQPYLLSPGALRPADLQSAYNLRSAAARRGHRETVAVVDAYNDPTVAQDLARYRAQWHQPACDTATGAGCVSVVNQRGKPGPLPAADPGGGWESEESIDVQMVSAICPHCHILLVEANDSSIINLPKADNTAVRDGARFVSDSWGNFEYWTEPGDDHYFNHPGVAITVAAGDFGYGPSYPATSQFVTSVGGTSLAQVPHTARGWKESAWNSLGQQIGATGGGCSMVEAKPAWQVDADPENGCLKRTDNDVAAVADPNTPVWFYDSFQTPGLTAGWELGGGTSVAAPIIAAVYALAGTPAAGTYPASYLYRHSSALYPVAAGTNGSCEPNRQYLCNAAHHYPGTRYNGPAGLGTPDGTGAFADRGSTNVVTIEDPGTQVYEAGAAVSLQLVSVDSRLGSTLSYTADLPAGLTISPGGRITGRLGRVPGTSTVKVTASDGAGAPGSVSFQLVSVASLARSYHAAAGPVPSSLEDSGGLQACLTDANDSSAAGSEIEISACDQSAAQDWEFKPGAEPGSAGALTINGKCADTAGHGIASGTGVQLAPCTGRASQRWLIQPPLPETVFDLFGQLVNKASRRCLAIPSFGPADGTPVQISDCDGEGTQAWSPPSGPITSGLAGMCIEDRGDSDAVGAAVQIGTCDGSNAQKWSLTFNGTLEINGECLDVTNRNANDGNPLQLAACFSDGTQSWAPGPHGLLVNTILGKCVAAPGSGPVSGTQLVLGDCYGSAGEIWAPS